SWVEQTNTFHPILMRDILQLARRHVEQIEAIAGASGRIAARLQKARVVGLGGEAEPHNYIDRTLRLDDPRDCRRDHAVGVHTFVHVKPCHCARSENSGNYW